MWVVSSVTYSTEGWVSVGGQQRDGQQRDLQHRGVGKCGWSAA